MSPLSGGGAAGAPAPSTSLPCPAWCARGAGHGFDDESLIHPGLLSRDHEVDIGPVWVAADEYAVGPEGPLWEREEPRVYLEKQIGLDAAQVRELAAALLQAAELLDGAR